MQKVFINISIVDEETDAEIFAATTHTVDDAISELGRYERVFEKKETV